jgi:hypothetical protein
MSKTLALLLWSTSMISKQWLTVCHLLLLQVLAAVRSGLHFVNPSDPRMPGAQEQASAATHSLTYRMLKI